MLYPQINKYRQCIDLSGLWNFRFDFNDEGLKNNWQNGLNDAHPIAVPASWNDQFADNRDFLGPAWYQTFFNLPWSWENHRIFLRFGSVNYVADVWLNGEKLGQHEGGHLPFEYDITSLIKNENNRLIVRVNGNLAKEHVPPSGRPLNYPNTNFDFFPFCGIHRPVLLYAMPKEGIKDLTVITTIQGNNGYVNIKIQRTGNYEAKAFITLSGHSANITSEISLTGESAKTTLSVDNAELWSPEAPNLYDLIVELSHDGIIFDSYSLSIGIRTIEVKGNQLLLNGKPIKLTGFGRHEDFPIIGKGYFPVIIIKDFALLSWIGANSFRTSHYPYSEQMIDLADRLGFLVIDETPAVGLTFDLKIIDRHFELCQQYIQELIARDKNHPSVIMWSLANEPHRSIRAKEFFRKLYEIAKKKDTTRPVTIANMMGTGENTFKFLDIICLNRYYGWYTQPGRIEEGIELLAKELDKLYKKYSKPIILSEFGTDTIPGCHAQPPEMFSEEYQMEFIRRYIELLNTKDYVVGQHVWNLCDFKTAQGILRAGGLNYKGVFTRDRRPKMAAHILRKLWRKP